jgi:predicted AlkP superfamily phosphohydrolase/phosphomutase
MQLQALWGRLFSRQPPFQAALLLFSILTLTAACGTRSSSLPKVIVIGVDGMDPEFVGRHWSDLPNLAALRDRGSFARLATTTPPQSPVAWSTFTTGLDPAGHGIFDFVHRDPNTMEPFLSMGETRPPRFSIPLGPYELPLSRPQVVSLRKGKAFWELLEARGIPATVIHMPANYPPVESGAAISGMGTPDLRGTQGTFSFFTDNLDIAEGSVPGGRILRAELLDGHAELNIEGPPNSLRRDRQYAMLSLHVDIDPDQPFARLAAGDAMAIVREGEWSEWIPVDFVLIPHLASVHGMFRVFARQLRPRFDLYISPVNVDPRSPDLPISVPKSFSREIALRTGRYSTLGIPEDTSALRQGVFNLEEFLSQSRLVMADERKLLDDSLNQFREGLLFYYFSSVDQNSHILWGHHEAELLDFYRAVDASIGEVQRREPGAELMVMSDHGFASFDRAVGLNTWLEEQGLLARKSNGEIDWSRTKIYAMGLNAVYVNLAGRERFGIVQPGPERDALIQRVRERLLALRDPNDGGVVIETVSDTHAASPDLIVGYARGYRASWETGIGSFSSSILEDNVDPWTADHCINAADVPGVLFTTRKIRVADPALKDLPVSLLALFGLPPGTGMTGRSVY